MAADTSLKSKAKKPEGLAAAAPTVARESLRDPMHALAREPLREPLRDDGIIRNRAGEPVARTRTDGVDKFHIDPRIIPIGWSWEWKRARIHNMEKEEDTFYQLELRHNGWEPVLLENHPGLFGAAGSTGAIVRDGLMLMERDKRLTDQAYIEVQRKTAATSINATNAISKEAPAYGASIPNTQKDYRGSFVTRERVPVTKDISIDS